MNVTANGGNPTGQQRVSRRQRGPGTTRVKSDPVVETVSVGPAVEPTKPNPFDPEVLRQAKEQRAKANGNGNGAKDAKKDTGPVDDDDDGDMDCDAVPGKYVADVMCPGLEMSVKRALHQAKSYVSVDDLLSLKLIKAGQRPTVMTVTRWGVRDKAGWQFNLQASVMSRNELQATVAVGTDRTRQVALATLQGAAVEGAAWAVAAVQKLRDRNTVARTDRRRTPDLTLTVGELINLGATKSEVGVLPTANDSSEAASVKIIEAWNAADWTEARTPAGGVREVVLTPFTQIFDDAPTWVWTYGGYGRIMRGTLSIWGGRPGAGKSTAARWFCAEATKGTLAGCFHGEPQSVAYIGSEESFEYMVKPSLRAHGADMARVMHVKTYSDGRDCRLLAAEDEAALTEQLLAHGVTVVVVDPLMSTVDGKTDIYKNNETRQVVEPWARIAQATDGVVIGITHLVKNTAGGDILAALQGSSAYGEVARSVFGLVKGEDGTRVLSQVKNSAGRDDLNLTYEIVETEVTTDSGVPATVTRFTITGESDRTASEVLQDQSGGAGGGGGSVRTQVGMFLGKLLAGGPCWAADGITAAEAAGFSEDQIKKHRRACGVESKKAPGDGRWFWATEEQLKAKELPADIDDVGGVVMG